jgi:hypothetical protein
MRSLQWLGMDHTFLAIRREVYRFTKGFQLIQI